MLANHHFSRGITSSGASSCSCTVITDSHDSGWFVGYARCIRSDRYCDCTTAFGWNVTTIFPEIASPSSIASGTSIRSNPGASGTSCCQPHHARVYPSRIRNPLPGSIGPSGGTSGALLMFRRASAFPRFSTSSSRRPLPLPCSTGRSTRKSALNSTSPCSLRGASLMSAMVSLAGCTGSTAKYALPSTCVYAPTLPNARPSAKGLSEVTSSLVTGIAHPLIVLTFQQRQPRENPVNPPAFPQNLCALGELGV